MSKAAQLVRNAGNWALIVYHLIGPLFLQLAVTRFVFVFFIAADAAVGIYRNTVISKFIKRAPRHRELSLFNGLTFITQSQIAWLLFGSGIVSFPLWSEQSFRVLLMRGDR